MNPYDFVRINWDASPERRTPFWHHRLFTSAGQPLYSGHLDVNMYVEKPIFIGSSQKILLDPKRPISSLQNGHGEYIIPGSSLKGMLRYLVETLGNGCMAIFDGEYEHHKVDYNGALPMPFRRCLDSTRLCIACRIFGLHRGGRDGERGNFLGKVNIGDAVADPDTLQFHEPIYTKTLMEPKAHHASFYLDESRRRIAGRKYYFHHTPEAPLQVATRLIYNKGGNHPANRYIRPIDYTTVFHFRLDFNSLEQDEFAVLLFAIVLEDDMRHKLGYAKPLGLGTVQLMPRSMTLLDYSTRYTRSGTKQGKTVIEGDEVWHFIYEQSDKFIEKGLARMAMEDLHRIWLWPPEPDVDYYYPGKRNWFDTSDSIGKRIADTKYVPG